jgi:hypothetical protein
MRILFENGTKQLAMEDDETLVILWGGVNWYWPKTVEEALMRMLTKDWDETITAMAALVKDTMDWTDEAVS